MPDVRPDTAAHIVIRSNATERRQVARAQFAPRANYSSPNSLEPLRAEFTGVENEPYASPRDKSETSLPPQDSFSIICTRCLKSNSPFAVRSVARESRRNLVDEFQRSKTRPSSQFSCVSRLVARATSVSILLGPRVHLDIARRS